MRGKVWYTKAMKKREKRGENEMKEGNLVNNMLPKELLVNRELSWLEFNKRVLQEAFRSDVPLLERLRFISIYCSNLDEFFMVRVGSLTDQSITNPRATDDKTGWTAQKQMEQVLTQLHRDQKLAEQAFAQVKEELGEHGVDFVDLTAGTRREKAFAANCFANEIEPFLTSHIVDQKHPFPFLYSKEKYIVAAMTTKSGSDKICIVAQGKLPDYFAVTMEGRTKVFFTSDLIEHYIESIFPKKKIAQVFTMRITRNADLSAEDAFASEGLDFRSVMQDMLKKRRRLFVVRLQTSKKPVRRLLEELCQQLRLRSSSVFVQSIPLDFRFGMTLDSAMGAKAAALRFPERKPWMPHAYCGKQRVRDIAEQESLLVYPYHSYTPFLNLLYEAADDADVVSIKISLYRMAGHSKVVSALCRAAERGKDVLVMMELRARFDEQSNIDYSQILEEAGCRVMYGLNDYKTHAKLCVITRQVDGEVQYTTQIGTGNYNEKTAEQYVDLSFLTNDVETGAEASQLFHRLSIDDTVEETDCLWVAPHCFLTKVTEQIDREIAEQRRGGAGRIAIKVNSLNDMEIMAKLVEASQAGVSVSLFVRGICCLRPGIPGFTDHITIRSLIGRYLEHERIFAFGEGERETIFLGSGDLLERNTRHRVELFASPKSAHVRDQLRKIMQLQEQDTTNSWEMQPDGSYIRVTSENPEKRLCAQETLRAYLREQER